MLIGNWICLHTVALIFAQSPQDSYFFSRRTKNIVSMLLRSQLVGHPLRGLLGSSGAITRHSNSVSSYRRMIKLPQFGSLNHIDAGEGIPFVS